MTIRLILFGLVLLIAGLAVMTSLSYPLGIVLVLIGAGLAVAALLTILKIGA